METKFNFNSSVCTSVEYSRRLLALGLKKETADMCWTKMARISGTFYVPELAPINMVSWRHTPAWSLHRLIKMLPKVVWYKDVLERKYHPIVEYESVNYVTEDGACLFDEGNDVWESMIVVIEWLIKEGYFNKEYLENGNC